MTAIFVLIFTSTLLLGAAASPPQPSPPLPLSPPDSCTQELVAFSPCLGYISAEPNNLTNTVTSQCCDAVSKAFNSSDGSNCFCYFMRQPLIFGFPLNDSRVVSLPSVCASRNGYGGLAMMDTGSLESICSGSPALPPLRSTTGSVIPKAPDSGSENVSSPSTSLPTENAETSPTPLSLTPKSVASSPTASKSPLLNPASRSSAVKLISNCWFLPGALTFLAIF